MAGGSNDDNRDLVGVCVAALAVTGAAAVYAFKRRSVPSRDLEGLTVCLTGGNVGIGRAVALKLGQRGAKLLIGCRNLQQAQRVCNEIGNQQCFAYALDLASPASIESFSESVKQQTLRSGLHLLINNAGAMINHDKKTTTDGWDTSMAVNHLGWVQLTHNLLPVLQKTGSSTGNGAGIVNVGSKLEKTALLPVNNEWDDWMKLSPDPYTPFKAYAKGKLSMTAVTFHWAQQLEEGISMTIVSPGMVNTNLPRFMPLWKRFLSWPFRALLLRTPEQAASTVLFAALSDTAQSGQYYNAQAQPIHEDPQQCSEAARSPEVQQQIWDATWRAIEKRKP